MAIGKDLATPSVRARLGRYPELGKQAVARIPGAKLVEFPDMGHSPQPARGHGVGARVAGAFTNRYIGGLDPFLRVITAQTIALGNERNDVDILRRRMDASVLLIKSLGGGWNVSQLSKL